MNTTPEYITDLFEKELVWFPEKELGYFPVGDDRKKYNEEYFEKYVRYEKEGFAIELNKQRAILVNEYVKGVVLDIGIGCGTFIKVRGNCYGYDINPAAVDWLVQRGLYMNPYVDDLSKVEGLTFFDSFEHIKDIEKILKRLDEQVVTISIPIFENVEHVLSSKHFRKDEHCFYFTRRSLFEFMWRFGYDCRIVTAFEMDFGREDIWTFVFGEAKRR